MDLGPQLECNTNMLKYYQQGDISYFTSPHNPRISPSYSTTTIISVLMVSLG